MMIGLENFGEVEKWLWVGEGLKVKIHETRLNDIIP